MLAPLALDRMLTLDALTWAWMRVRENRGAAGADHVTIRRFGMALEPNLLSLGDDVREGSYRPGPIRFVSTRGPGKIRRLAILPVRDRVLQRAALDLLMPHIDPQFLPSSYGYRPNRSLHDAVSRIVALRNRGLTTVVDADIRRCFDSLDHDMLRASLRRLAPGIDDGLWRLLDVWIDTPNQRHRPGAHAHRPRGVLQGAPLSPLLCNVYLHGLDQSLARRRLSLVRYADDFVVLCKSPEHGEMAMRAVEKVLSGLRLSLNPAKTSLTGFDEGFVFLGVGFRGETIRYDVEGKRVISDSLPPSSLWHGPSGYDDD